MRNKARKLGEFKQIKSHSDLVLNLYSNSFFFISIFFHSLKGFISLYFHLSKRHFGHGEKINMMLTFRIMRKKIWPLSKFPQQKKFQNFAKKKWKKNREKFFSFFQKRFYEEEEKCLKKVSKRRRWKMNEDLLLEYLSHKMMAQIPF